jgi:hypothetical protein
LAVVISAMLDALAPLGVRDITMPATPPQGMDRDPEGAPTIALTAATNSPAFH